MNPLRGTLQLTNGGWIVDDTTGKSILYRRQFGAATIRIPYVLRDDGYILGRILEIGSDRQLVEKNAALLVISEIIQQLKKAGIAAQLEGLMPPSCLPPMPFPDAPTGE